jgi:hypothetical protein
MAKQRIGIVFDQEGHGVPIWDAYHKPFDHILTPRLIALGYVIIDLNDLEEIASLKKQAEATTDKPLFFSEEEMDWGIIKSHHYSLAQSGLGLGLISNTLKHKEMTLNGLAIGNFTPLPPLSTYDVALNAFEMLEKKPELLMNYGSTDLEYMLEALFHNGLPLTALDAPKIWADATNGLIQCTEKHSESIKIGISPTNGRQFSLRSVVDVNSLSHLFLTVCHTNYAEEKLREIANDRENASELRQAALGILSHQALNDAIATTLVAVHLYLNEPEVWEKLLEAGQPRVIKQKLIDFDSGCRVIRRFKHRDNPGNPSQVAEKRDFFFVVGNNLNRPLDPKVKTARESLLVIDLLADGIENHTYRQFLNALNNTWQNASTQKAKELGIQSILRQASYGKLFYRLYPDSSPYIEPLNGNYPTLGNDDKDKLHYRLELMRSLPKELLVTAANCYFESLVQNSQKRQKINDWHDFSVHHCDEIRAFHYTTENGKQRKTTWEEKKAYYDTCKAQHGQEARWQTALTLWRRLIYREAREQLIMDNSERLKVMKYDALLSKDTLKIIRNPRFNNFMRDVDELKEALGQKKIASVDAEKLYKLYEEAILPQFNATVALMLGVELGESTQVNGQWYVNAECLTRRKDATAIHSAYHQGKELFNVSYKFAKSHLGEQHYPMEFIADKQDSITVDGQVYRRVYVPLSDDCLHYVTNTLPSKLVQKMNLSTEKQPYSFECFRPAKPEWEKIAAVFEQAIKARQAVTRLPNEPER